MKTFLWATVAMLLGASYTIATNAQASDSPTIEQPSTARQTAFQTESFNNALADAGTSPSNVPPAPPVPAAPSSGTAAVSSGTAGTTASGSGSTAPEEKKDEEKKPDDKPADEGPYKLFHGKQLDDAHLDIRGFVNGGYTYNNDNPQSRINGPVTFNDHDDEFQLNQLYLIAERVTKVENNCGTDIGGRIDLLYGSDHRFSQTNPGTGWDGNWNEGSNEYGLSIPQLYVDLAVNKTVFRIGHFYAPCGYESVMAQDSPFYSHTYNFQYGEPFTLTGGEAIYTYNDNWTFNGGLDTGWNNFDSNPNQAVNGFGGYTWTSKSKDTTFAQEFFIGENDAAGNTANRFLLNSVLTQKIGCGETKKWRYALEANYGTDGGLAPGGGSANWWGFTNYLFYDVNDCWTVGFRQEYFDDSKGAVVTQIGPPAFTPVGSRYNDLTLGVAYKPNKNVQIRTEIRGDFAGNGQTTNLPFGSDHNNNDQFLLDTDIIVRF